MIDFLFAPILSLFSPRFYQNVLKSSLWKGFLYLAYLSLSGALTFLILISLKWLPTVENFVDWFARELPTMVFENGSLSSSVQQPYHMTHPKFGKILILDTTKEKADPSELKNAFLYVTKRIIYVSNPLRGETRIFDLSSPKNQRAIAAGSSQITGELVKFFYKKIKPIFLVTLFSFVFLFIFLWKLVAAILYSVIAVVLNQFREEKFSYEKLLNVTIFAMTAISLLQFLNALVTGIQAPVPFWVALVLTTSYLGLAILVVSLPEKTLD